MARQVKMVCPRCLGSGETLRSLLTRSRKRKIPCPQCKGKKYLYVDKLT